MTLGETIRRYRLQKGWTQQQLGEMVRRSKNNISQYETNRRRPPYDLIVAFSKLYGISTDQLLGGEEEKHPAQLHEARQLEEEVPVYDGLRYESSEYAPAVAYRKVEPAFLDAPHFYYYAPDDAMSGMRICQGDLLLIRASKAVRPGEIMLIALRGQPAQLRIIEQLNEKSCALIAANSRHPMLCVEREQVRVFGSVVKVEFMPQYVTR